MPKQKIDVEIGAEATGKINPAEITKAHQGPPKDGGDVSGQWVERRIMRCWRCGGLSYIWYDTDVYRYYECPYDGAVNVL